MRPSAVSGITATRWVEIANRLREADEIAIALQHSGLSDQQIEQFYALSPRQIGLTQAWFDSHDRHHLLTALDESYPAALREIHRFPPLLYIKGDPAVLSTMQLAVVGSRHCSPYGRQWGAWFAQQLALSDLAITSGLVRGIDGIAHRAALAEEIVEKGGALVSEFPLMTLPFAANFPRRNRIISGLSRGVLVVEATIKSGSLVTARCALEQNRNVYALPGALLVAYPGDIVEDLRASLNWLPFTQPEAIYSEVGDDVPLPFAEVLANVGDEVTPVDVVAERAGQPVPVIAGQLLELELAGWIAAVPGGYVRFRRACHVRRTNVLV
ncbi:DNA protecting protein DprA|nr:DNA protecting protein DprA [Candidatus Pantoea persica]